MNVELKCEKCPSITKMYFPDKCLDCMKEESKNDPVMIEMRRQDRWRQNKRFAWHMLLYVPVPVSLGLIFGVPIYLAFIAGTIYMSLLPSMIDWLSEVF